MSWPLVALKNCCEIVMGQAPVGSSYNDVGEGFALVAGAGDFGEASPTPKKWTTSPTKISEVGDVILCIRATIGDLNWSDKNYCLGRGVAGLRPYAKRLNKNYLWHFLLSQSDNLSALGTGSTFKQISRIHINEFKIPLPPLEEQKRIAAILDKADAIRRKRLQAIELTDTLLKSVFLDMFGDPVTNPKGWSRSPLSTFISKLTSGSRGWAKYYSDKGGKFLRIQNVGFADLKLQDMAYVQAPDNAEAKRTLVRPGDLLLSITADLGRTGVVPVGFGEGYINQHLAKLTLKNICPYFVSHYISSNGGLSILSASDKGGVKAGLNFNDVNDYQIFDTPVGLQQNFREIRIKIQDRKTKNTEAFGTDESLLASLTQRAFKGELTAKDLDQIEAAE